MNAAAAIEIAFDSEGLTERMVRQLKVAGEDWLDGCRRLSDFEERYLADEPLNEDALITHGKALTALESVGRLLSLPIQDPLFPDRHFAERVASMIRDLKDRRAMWHGKMSSAQREQLLREVFNEV